VRVITSASKVSAKNYLIDAYRLSTPQIYSASSMKKLIRITTAPMSLEKLLENQARFFSNSYDITLISSDEERLEKIARSQGVKFFHLGLTRKITLLQDLKCLITLIIFLRKERPDYVHSHTPKAGIIGMMAAFMARVPVRMHTVAGLPLMEALGFRKMLLVWVERLTCACSTHVYPNSHELKKYLIQNNFCPEKKLKVIGSGSSNGIDTSYFDPEKTSLHEKKNLRKSLGISPKNFVFSFIGRVVTDKGINELVQAFVNVVEKNKGATLLLVGPQEGDLNPLLSATLDLIKSRDDIIEVGYQADVRAFFAITDVFVFPSYREGFPNVVLQAGAMGIPCIVSNINGSNEIIRDGQNGFIVPVKNVQKLQQKMELSLQKPDYLRSSKTDIRSRIMADFEREVFLDLLSKEYQILGSTINIQG
jgi:glycosyltransferase involved in cell wall biosynthesis